MRVLFLTDSLSLPRINEKERVFYEDTYLYALRKKFPEILIIDSAIGGATIKQLYNQVFYYKVFKPDLIILQSGIVDCAPRAYRSIEKKILVKTGLISKLKKLTYFLRKYRGLTLTKPKHFRKYLSKIVSDFPEAKVHSLGILPASHLYEKKVPNIIRNVKKYNDILMEQTSFIDTSDIPNTAIMNDYHHLNKLGHQLLFEKLEILLVNLIGKK